MASYNRIIIVGNLTRDPDYKLLASGQAVSRLSMATNRQFKNRQTGALVQEVCYVDVDVWGAQAESCRQYLQKGKPILVEGRLKYDSWESEGQKRNKHSIVADRVVFLGNGSQNEESDSEVSTGFGGGESPALSSGLEKDLLDQIDRLKIQTLAKSVAKKSSTGGEIEFKDQPPFADDLAPF